MPNPLIRERAPSYNGDGSGDFAVFDCIIERVTFHNAENGYAVVKVTPSETKAKAKGDVITVLGSFTNPVVGESLRCHGTWIKHPQYGSQFKMERYETLRPATAAAIEKYLGSGMVKGIGPATAKRIVDKFGEKTLDIIENEPKKLAKVSGLGEKRIDLIKAAWDEQKEVRAIMLFLQGHGVSPTYAVKIYKFYKERAIEVVEKNPFQLANDIWGIGFKSADKIAQNIGIALDAPERLEAGLVYVLNQEMDNGGHCFLLEDDLITKSIEILGAEHGPVERSLVALVERGLLDAETVEMVGHQDTAIYTPSIHTTEKAVAERVNTLLSSPWRSRPKPQDLDDIVADVPGYAQLSDEQRLAVRRALSEPIMVLTGGPGCGKTFTTKVIVAAFEKLGKRLQLASPTGRAAKRAAEVTGREAKTIHRMLAFDPEKKGFKHGPGEPLELDVLIIDEASMLDLVLTHHTLRAVPDGAQIIFVGDVDQLPSVGPGNVLGDFINSGRVPVARLTQVFRQAAESKIITNAHAINRGKMPDLPPPSAIHTDGADCVFVEVDESDEMPMKLAGVVAKSLPKLGYKPADITVLAPMQRGSVGARNLNEVLQSVLNPRSPDKPEHQRGPVVYRVGDRVMQRVNNYDKNVFNGDVGHIIELDKENQTVAVEYIEGVIEYDFVDLDQLAHALSITIHKCIREDERVWTVERGLVPIRDLSPGDCIWTGRDGARRVVAKFNTGEKPVVRVTTRAGYQIDVSEEHPLLVATPDSATARFVTAGELTPDLFACLNRTIVDSRRHVFLPAPPLPVRQRLAPMLPTVLDERLAYLLGALVGDGSYRDAKDGTVDFTNQDADVLSLVEETLTAYGLRVCRYQRAGQKATRLYVVSLAFREWLCEMRLDYTLAKDKIVPPCVFAASASVRGAFLRGLFDTDGSAGIGSCRGVRFVSASAALAHDVQQLLLSLGIVSVRKQNQGASCVTVSGTSLQRFADSVGFNVGYKRERLNAILRLAATVGKSNHDFVPFGGALICEIAAAFNDAWTTQAQGGFYARNEYAAGGLLSRLKRGVNNISYRHLHDLIEALERVGAQVPPSATRTATNRYFYDPIASVERLNERSVMYDIEVEDVHSFVAGGGFVCHNSQGSEYPACVIALHTQHYMMLQRNLVYTALTRAKKLAVFVGSKRAIQMAVRNQRVVPRNTRLSQRLQHLVDDLGPNGLPRRGAGPPKPQLPTPPMPGRLL